MITTRVSITTISNKKFFTLFTAFSLSCILSALMSLNSYRLFFSAGQLNLMHHYELNINNTENNKKTVALCITGNTRTFHYPVVHENILEYILKPLRQKYQTDVFFNVKFEDNEKPGSMKANSSRQATYEAIHKFNATYIHELSSTDDFHFVNFQNNSNQRVMDKPKSCNHVNQTVGVQVPNGNYRTSQCLEIIKKHEKKIGLRYDWIYKTRPDVVILDPIIQPHEIQNGHVHVNSVPFPSIRQFIYWWGNLSSNANNSVNSLPDVGDHFLACNRNDADIAFNAVQVFNNCSLYQMPFVPNSEAQILLWYLNHHVTPVVHHWLWVVVRVGIGAECWRIPMFRINNATLLNDMIDRCASFWLHVNKSMNIVR